MESRSYPLVYPPPAPPTKKVRKVRPWKPKGPFRFFALPSEIRNRIYEFALLVPRTLDLDLENRKDIAYNLDLLRTCRRVHEEAYPIFYGLSTFRLFPTSPQFFHTKKVLFSRLPERYLNAITTVELRLGPGWSKPPKCWNMGPKLGLKHCKSLRNLRIFIEVDPSNPIFTGFRMLGSELFYTLFCGNILEELMGQVPSIREVNFEAFPSVRKDSPLVVELAGQADAEGKRISWSGNWDGMKPAEDCDILEMRFAQLSVAAPTSEVTQPSEIMV